MDNKKYTKEEMTEAYLKFKSYVYYETHNLLLRAELAKFESDGSVEKKLEDLANSINNYVNKKEIPSYLSKINYWVLPKEIAYKEKEKPEENILTNISFFDEYEFVRPKYIINCPIEIHIISILWILKVGYLLERTLPIPPYGYKLDLNENGRVRGGLKLFELYFKKYQEWRDHAIQSAKDLAKEKKNALIIGLDIKDFYHSVRFNFEDIYESLKESESLKPNFFIDDYQELADLLEIVHKNYFEKMPHDDKSNKRFLLPIGLLSSGVIGNWYLKNFDKAVLEKINPIYYGRYVDDILMVISNSRKEDVAELRKMVEVYFKKDRIIIYNKNKKSFFVLPEVYKYPRLCIQDKKINVLYFDYKEPIGILEKFSHELRKNSSEFRFLPIEDEVISDFNGEAYSINYSGSKFKLRSIKEFNENKFGVSKFLAKNIYLSQKSLRQSNPEIKRQILSFFRGKRTLDFKELWEKVLTYFLINNQAYEFKEIIKEAINSIENLKKVENKKIMECLFSYLKQSAYIALSLNPAFIKGKKFFEELNRLLPSFGEELGEYVFYYRKSNMLRHNYVVFPLLNFTEQSLERSKPLNLSSINVIKLLNSEVKLNLYEGFFSYSPRFVHFHEIATFIFFKKIFKYNPSRRGNKDIDIEYFSYLEEAFEVFFKINYSHNFTLNNANKADADEEGSKEFYQKIKSQFFELSKTLDENLLKEEGFPFHINITSNKNVHKKKINVALANFRIENKVLSHKYLRNPFVEKGRISNIYQLFNDVRREGVKSKGFKVDLFVLPEVSIPLILLDNIIRFSLKEKIVSIFGLEHIINSQKYAFNVIVTLLPVKLEKYNSLIPIFRLKNHYSPEEKRLLNGFGFKIPRVSSAYYHLFNWSNVRFTVFNCYELADISHRASFKSKVDFVVACEFNSDINYFSNIVESSAREIHCYFIQSNNSKFGDCRITQPAKTEKKDKLKIKGGKNSTILVETIDIDMLREFQLCDYNLQRDSKDLFKATPPAFNKKKVLDRID